MNLHVGHVDDPQFPVNYIICWRSTNVLRTSFSSGLFVEMLSIQIREVERFLDTIDPSLVNVPDPELWCRKRNMLN